MNITGTSQAPGADLASLPTSDRLGTAGRLVTAGRIPTVEIVIPAFNEEADLERNVRRLRAYLDDGFPFRTVVTIADNASTDHTWEISSRLAAQLAGVRAIHLAEKGRGRALKAAWNASTADVVAYMDVDLSTGLDAILPLVAPLLSGHSDVAIGSRLARGARVVRGPKREVISRTYNLMVKTVMGNGFSDAQCGFKAVRADVARRIMPLVVDNGWFFDTELLVVAQHNGLRIHEVPVDWTDDPDSRVDICRTAVADLRGLWRVSRQLHQGGHRLAPTATAATREIPRRSLGSADHVREADQVREAELTARFVTVGTLSTVAYLVLLVVLDTRMSVLTANAVALTACAAVNTAVHWRTLTAVTARHVARRQLRSAGRAATASWAAGLLSSTLALAVVGAVSASVVATLVAAIAANSVVSMGRFLVLRSLAYRHHLAGLTAGGHTHEWRDGTSTPLTTTKSPDGVPGAERDIHEDLMNVV